MKLAKINVTVSEDAKKILTDYKAENDIDNLDSSLEALLEDFQSVMSK